MAAQDEIILPDEGAAPPEAQKRHRRWPHWLGGFALLLGLAAGWLWLSRENIADDYLASELEAMGLPATYKIGTIGPVRQVLSGVVIGDPARPDFTADEVSLEVNYTFGIPSVGRISLLRPRLFGQIKDGKPSFGSLDKVLFTGAKEAFRLPDLDIAVVDGRALVFSDFGPVGIKLDGKGELRGGFAGKLAVTAPELASGACRASGVSAYGTLAVKGERPEFDGPLRMAALSCGGLQLADAAIATSAKGSAAFDAVDADLSLATGKLAMDGIAAGSGSGKVRVGLKSGDITARYDLALARVTGPQIAAASFGTEGIVRTQGGFTRIEADGTLSGSGIAPGPGLERALAGAEAATAGTFAAPMLAQVRTALKREARGSELAGTYTLRQTGKVTNVVVPQASLTGGSGRALLSFSRLQVTAGAGGSPRISGNFLTGGAGLPRMTGRVERREGGQVLMRMAMAEYRAGTGRLSVPEMMIAQGRGGELGFAGRVLLSGALPGGRAEGLVLPVEGNWSAARGLAAWRRCTPVAFDKLSLAALTLDRRSITLCPGAGGAILRADGQGLRIAAGASGLTLTGKLASAPIRVTSGAVGMAWPGNMIARAVSVELGSGEPSRFTIAAIDGKLGQQVSGSFSGLEARLAAVPLDVVEGTGGWRLAGAALHLDGAAFRLLDRQPLARFKPLLARDARLSIIDGIVTADALLREPGSDVEVVRTAILHNLSQSSGHADLFIDGIVFNKRLQPDALSDLTLGVIANASGTVTGRGRIDWSADKVTSTGDFATDGMDFAAAFGPAKGVSGKVHFTDLLGLVTAPDQRLKIASINPGIEANDGELSFELRPDSLLVVGGAHWPFLDGTLELEPTRMVLGAAETRRFTLNITGLDAAKFIQRMDMGNIAATGIFDGTMPLIFDENGGRIERGVLVSRSGGGNVSYNGQLTYEDLSPMANFAFEALKSIDYKTMRIELDGALEGEIFTRVAFDGISQGTGTRRNFITRQIARLPIKFNVNLRAPFFKLITSVRSIYDPAFVRDPRTLGLIGPDGKPIRPPATPLDPRVQPPDSEKQP